MTSIVKLTDGERERRDAMKIVALVDSPSISNNDRTATDLQSARLSYELELHNLQSEFLIREDRVKQTYLARVREIVEG